MSQYNSSKNPQITNLIHLGASKKYPPPAISGSYDEENIEDYMWFTFKTSYSYRKMLEDHK